MSSDFFCPECGTKLDFDNRYCDSCGFKLENALSPTSDKHLAGVFVENLRLEPQISYKQILKLSQNADVADRIVAQLENTGNYKVRKEGNDYFINKISSEENLLDQEEQEEEFDVSSEHVSNLRNLLEVGPISVSSIPDMMHINNEQAEQLVGILLNSGNYQIHTRPDGVILYKRH